MNKSTPREGAIFWGMFTLFVVSFAFVATWPQMPAEINTKIVFSKHNQPVTFRDCVFWSSDTNDFTVLKLSNSVPVILNIYNCKFYRRERPGE